MLPWAQFSVYMSSVKTIELYSAEIHNGRNISGDRIIQKMVILLQRKAENFLTLDSIVVMSEDVVTCMKYAESIGIKHYE